MGAGETMWLLLCLSVVGSVLSQEAQVTDECPTKFGFYADAVQCDRYYECKDGQVRRDTICEQYKKSKSASSTFKAFFCKKKEK